MDDPGHDDSRHADALGCGETSSAIHPSFHVRTDPAVDNVHAMVELDCGQPAGGAAGADVHGSDAGRLGSGRFGGAHAIVRL
jgi:hypothetical protein